MSNESQQWLDTMTATGFVGEKGLPWHQTFMPDGSLPANCFDADVPFGVAANLFDRNTPAMAALSMTLADGTVMELPDRKAVYNADTGKLFGLFADGYEIHPFRTALLDTVAGILGDNLKIGSVGLLKSGALGWVQVEMPESISIDGYADEKVRPSILASASHNGTVGLRFMKVVTRVVCDNTLSAALREKGDGISFRHTRNSQDKYALISDALGIMQASIDTYEDELRDMTATTVTDTHFGRFLDLWTPLTNVDGTPKEKNGLTFAEKERAEITGLYSGAEGDPFKIGQYKGTAFGVLQAVNSYAQHKAIVRKVSRAERKMELTVTGKSFDNDRNVITTLNKVLGAAGKKRALVSAK